MHPRLFQLLSLSTALILLAGCQTPQWRDAQAARQTMLTAIAAEPEGDYFIGRRFFKSDYKFWGYVRKPRQPWSEAQLVMLNEHSKLAPDREANTLGSDNGFEYRLQGKFSGDTVYEPASNVFYPEFVLRNYELASRAPGAIFRSSGCLDPELRIIAKPY